MALALLELLDADGAALVFRLDRGTNTEHRLEIGSRIELRNGEQRLQDVYYVVPKVAGSAEAGTSPWEAGIELRVPHEVLRRGPAFAQLVTWKEGGRAKAVSGVVDLAGGAAMGDQSHSPALRVRAQSLDPADLPVADAARPARSVPHRLPPLAGSASLDTLIGDIVKLAVPLVTQLLQQGGTSAGPGASPAVPGGAALTGLMQVLQSLLGGASQPAAGSPLASTTALPRLVRSDSGNRFVSGGPRHVAEPFIFGIDDALIAGLIGSLAGPVLQVLPQLVNAANSKRIEMKKADSALMGSIVSDVQKRLMMDKLLESQRAAHAQGPAAEISPAQLQALIGLLGALPPASTTQAALPDPAAAKSLSRTGDGPRQRCEPSDRALVSFEFGPGSLWAGSEVPVFQRGRRLVLRPRLVVSKDAPSSPLPKAILRLQLRDSQHPEVQVEKTFKLRDLHAGIPLDCVFDAAELAPLPEQARLTLLAQLRWPHARSPGGTCATGAAELVLVGAAFLRQVGGPVDGEREPADMARYRSFWNKVWQSPASRDQAGARLWELDVQARFTALVDNRHDSNALMQIRLLAGAVDPEAVSARVQGRMKAGIELSLAELNRLLPLWNGRPPLDAETVSALGARPMLADAGREAFSRLRLKGRAGQTGMVWAVPVFQLRGYTLSQVSDVDERGQVSATAEIEIAFPMPVALRALGLKSST